VTVAKAPVIEWCTVTVSTEMDTKEWEKGLEDVKRALEGAEGYYGISTGWTVEMARTYQLLLGWESKEAHLNWKQKLSPEEAAKAMAMFRSGVDKVTLSHVKLEGEVTA
jgi:heme-degrading monooxygenase HmoA